MYSHEEKKVLDEFGKLLMQQVRDYSIQGCIGVINGDKRNPAYREIAEMMDELNQDQKDLILQFSAKIVNGVLFDFFELLSWKHKEFKLLAISEETSYDLSKISDGLYGEMLGKKGWVERFSEYKIDNEFL
jgi:hypothetical protein